MTTERDALLCACGHHGISHSGAPGGHCTMCRGRCSGMQTLRISLVLRERLVDLADSFLDEEADELEAELSTLIQRLTGCMCKHCGSYEKCPCDSQADQIVTGGY